MSAKIPEGMTSLTVRENYRVEVEVTVGATFGTPEENHARRRSELGAVVANIQRHVDGVASVSAMWDTRIACPHCFYSLDDRFQDGEPQCCTMAQDEFVALGFELSEA